MDRIIEIEKPCRNCGANIRCRYKDRGWALKNKTFCSNHCGVLWNSKTRDNMQATRAMRAKAQTAEAKTNRILAIRASPKIAAAVKQRSEERQKAEVIRKAITKPCACGCGTQIPTHGPRGREMFWVRGHQKFKPGCKERAIEKVPTGRKCLVCKAPILARRKEVNWAAKKRHTCSHKCSLELAVRGITTEIRAEMIKDLKERMAKDPRFCAGIKHHSVQPWRLRSPNNVVFEFRNLRLFIAEHESLFLPEDVKWKKSSTGFRCRALNGLCGLSARRSTVQGSWKGWTWHSQTERLKNESRDLLERSDWPNSAAALLRKTARPTLTAAQSAELLSESRG